MAKSLTDIRSLARSHEARLRERREDHQAMSPEEIRSIVHGVLAEQSRVTDDTLNEAIVKTVAAILTSFSIDEEDRKEIRADFVHLRKWRKSVEQAQSYTFKAVITVIAAGIVGAVWMGFKTMLGK